MLLFLIPWPAAHAVQEPEQLAIKSIVNTALAVQPASPHNAFYVGSCHAGGQGTGARLLYSAAAASCLVLRLVL